MNLPKSLLSKMHRLSKRDIEKLTKSAKGEECHIRTPYCKSDDSVVFAHLSGKSVLGAGMGFKGKPIGSYACHACHAIIDGRMKTDLERDWVWQLEMEGALRTMATMLDNGLLKIK